MAGLSRLLDAVVTGSLVECYPQLVDKDINFFDAANQRRRHDHGIAGLAHHQSVAVGSIAAEHGAGRFRRQPLAAGLVAHQLDRRKHALAADLAHDGVVLEFQQP